MASHVLDEYCPSISSPPGETLDELLSEAGMTQVDLAARVGLSPKTVNGIIHGTEPIAPRTALALESVFGLSAGFWIRLESAYRESQARQARDMELRDCTEWLEQFPWREAVKLGWFPKGSSDAQTVSNLLCFMGVCSPRAFDDAYAWVRNSLVVSFRRSVSFRSDPQAVALWLRQGEIQARSIDGAPFSADGLRGCLQRARTLTLESGPGAFLPKLSDACAQCGVAVVFVPEVGKTRVSGAARWLAPSKAIVQLSLRHQTNDHLWFAFFHECMHLLHHSRRRTFVDIEGDGGECEDEADKRASDLLIPAPQLRRWLAEGRPTKTRVSAFAHAIGVAPGIIVGRLQHDGTIGFREMNDLKCRYSWANASPRAHG